MRRRSGLVSAAWTIIFVLCAFPAMAEIIVDTAWVRRYDAPGYEEETPWDIAVDDSGNAYVTGNSYASGSGYDRVTVKYYPNGDTAWARTYNGPENGDDWVDVVGLDDSGCVYVTGGSWFSGAYDDYLTMKYYANGDTAWVRRYNGPGSYYDYADGMVVDGSGNAYVTGQSPGSGTGADYATIKYRPDGDTAWVRRYNGPANTTDAASAVAIDASGNVYVTGGSVGFETEYDYATVKYYPNGDTAWVRRYNGPGDSTDRASDVAVDDLGNVYVTGSSYDSATGQDYLTIKYYPDGDTAWVRRYNGPGDTTDYAWAINVDGAGNVSVTGQSYGDGTSCDYATIKYYPNGDTAWARRYNGPGNDYDGAYAMALDDYGNLYVTGRSYGLGTEYDYATVKYYPGGDTGWVRRYNGPGNSHDRAIAIETDGSDNIFVTGNSYGSGTGYDYATIKYVQILRGDANGDGQIDIADVMRLINYLFLNGSPPDPLRVGDCNCDEAVDGADVMYLINYLFLDGSPPDCP